MTTKAAEPKSSEYQQPTASDGISKKAIGWNSLLHHPSHHELPGVTARPTTAQAVVSASGTSQTRRSSKDTLLSLAQQQHPPPDKDEATDEREVPNEAIFNTQFTTAGRKFLTKVKKNRAMQVDRRTKGFQQGIELQTILIDPITRRHYRLLLVDPDMQRREDLADGLEQFFEVLVAPGNERALALLAMFKVDFVLLRAGLGNDNAANSSPALAFLHEIKKKFAHTPVSVMVPRMAGSLSPSANHPSPGTSDMEKLLQRLLIQGACGFFEDGLPVPVFVERLGKLLHSLVVAQTELTQCHGISHGQTELGDEVVPIQAIKKRGTAVSLIQRPATCKPDSITYDQHRMMLELSLNQRKRCLLQRQALTEALDSQHSVLGVELSLSVSASTGHVGLTSPAPSSSLRHSLSSPGGKAFGFTAERRNGLAKKIPPLPSQKEISRRIYAKPQEIQQKIHSHLYERFHAAKHDAMPQDPLLHHCIAIDPQTISKSSDKSLLVAKAFLLFEEQRYEEALLQANRAIKMQGNNLVKLAYVLRGALFDIGGQHARAEREFLVALELDPGLHQAHFNLSVSLLKMGKDTQALQEISLALQSDPLNEQYLRNRALIYRRTGNFTMAQSEYAKLEALPRSAAAAVLTKANALSPPVTGSFAKAESSAALLLLQSSSSKDGRSHSSLNTTKGDMEDGLFDHLFGEPTEDKVALVCPPKDRTPEMVDNIVALLQTVLVFQDFPAQVLRRVAELMEYEVVGCGKRFALGEDHPESFYVLLHGKLSVRRKFGDFASSVTTHHLEKGMTFGCTGHAVSLSTQLIADESSEVGILWPDAYDLSIRSFCTEKNSEIFKFLQQMKAFRHFSTSELGHIIGISERKRFRKGETILAQNEVPKHLCILWKGSCLMFQDFKKPPLCSDGDGANGLASSSDDESESGRLQRGARGHNKAQEKRVLPFHRYIAKPDWPLGFETSDSKKLKSRKQARGRRNALLSGEKVANSSQLLHSMASGPRLLPEKLKPGDKHALISTLVAPAVFGESAFLDQDHQHSKWYVLLTCLQAREPCWSCESDTESLICLVYSSIVADCIVEMLLFDHLRLQEMDLATEVVREISEHAPKCLNERQVVKRQAEKVPYLCHLIA